MNNWLIGSKCVRRLVRVCVDYTKTLSALPCGRTQHERRIRSCIVWVAYCVSSPEPQGFAMWCDRQRQFFFFWLYFFFFSAKTYCNYASFGINPRLVPQKKYDKYHLLCSIHNYSASQRHIKKGNILLLHSGPYSGLVFSSLVVAVTRPKISRVMAFTLVKLYIRDKRKQKSSQILLQTWMRKLF